MGEKPKDCYYTNKKNAWIVYYGYKNLNEPIRWWNVFNDADDVEDMIFGCVFGRPATWDLFLDTRVFRMSKNGVCVGWNGSVRPFVL